MAWKLINNSRDRRDAMHRHGHRQREGLEWICWIFCWITTSGPLRGSWMQAAA